MAVIHTEEMCVRDGTREIPFTLDIASSTARLDPFGASCDVRLLTWGEKGALSRYAGEGAKFIEQQLLATCVSGDVEAERKALIALVLWLHAPQGNSLALDSVLLARVTKALCPVLGIGPAELAALPTPDVEAIWLADDPSAQRTQSAPRADDTRIVVEPDLKESEMQGGDEPAAGSTNEAVDLKVEAEPHMPVSSATDRTAPEPNWHPDGHALEANNDHAERPDARAETNAAKERSGHAPKGQAPDVPSQLVMTPAAASRKKKSQDRPPPKFRLLNEELYETAVPANVAEFVSRRSGTPSWPILSSPNVPGAALASQSICADHTPQDRVSLPRPVDRPDLTLHSTFDGSPKPQRPVADSEHFDARLGGLVAIVTRPAETAEAEIADRQEQAAAALANELADAATALGIAGAR